MANAFKITQKLFDLEKELSMYIVRTQFGSAYKPIKVSYKVAAFDLLFSLSEDEQARILAYRAHLARTYRSIYDKHDVDQLEKLARHLDYKNLRDLEDWAWNERWDKNKRAIDPNKRIDTSKMVSKFLPDGYQTSAGFTLKRHLDQLLNGDASKRIKIIN